MHRSVGLAAGGAALVLAASGCAGPSQRYDVDMQSATGGSYMWTTNVAGYALQGLEQAPRTAFGDLSPGENLTVTVDGAGSLLGQCVVYRVMRGERTQVFSDVQELDFIGDGSSEPAVCYFTEPLRG